MVLTPLELIDKIAALVPPPRIYRIAINSACQFNIAVLALEVGSFVNTAGNVTSANGGTGGTGSASINVVMGPLIPTLSSWALALLAAMLFLAALRYMRKREG